MKRCSIESHYWRCRQRDIATSLGFMGTNASASRVQSDGEGEAVSRARLLEVTISVLRERPVRSLSLRIVAEEAGLPLSEVSTRWPTWTELLVAALIEWHGRRVSAAAVVAHRDGAVAFLRAILKANLAEPALARALVGTITVATVPNHPLAAVMQREWAVFHAFVRRMLANDVQGGREPDTMDPDRGAEQLLAMYEGLQVQSMLRPGMDLLQAYDRATARLREGWSTPYVPPS